MTVISAVDFPARPFPPDSGEGFLGAAFEALFRDRSSLTYTPRLVFSPFYTLGSFFFPSPVLFFRMGK